MKRSIQSETEREVGPDMQLRHRDQQEAEAGEQREMQGVAEMIQRSRP